MMTNEDKNGIDLIALLAKIRCVSVILIPFVIILVIIKYFLL